MVWTEYQELMGYLVLQGWLGFQEPTVATVSRDQQVQKARWDLWENEDYLDLGVELEMMA